MLYFVGVEGPRKLCPRISTAWNLYHLHMMWFPRCCGAVVAYSSFSFVDKLLTMSILPYFGVSSGRASQTARTRSLATQLRSLPRAMCRPLSDQFVKRFSLTSAILNFRGVLKFAFTAHQRNSDVIQRLCSTGKILLREYFRKYGIWRY